MVRPEEYKGPEVKVILREGEENFQELVEEAFG